MMKHRMDEEFLDYCEEALKTHAMFGWLSINRLRVLAGRPFLERESFGDSDWRKYDGKFLTPIIAQARERLKSK